MEPVEGAVPQLRASDRTPRQLVTIVAGVVMAAGCFMPWMKVSVFTIIGTDGSDWWLFAGLAVVVVLLQFDEVERGFVQVLLGIGALLLWVLEYAHARDATEVTTLAGPQVQLMVGEGLWAILAAALTITGAACAMLLAERRARENAEPHVAGEH
jgi:hypothetical protein